MARKVYTFKNHLKESLKDPKFKKAWEESEVEYQISRQIIAQRLAKKMTQGQLARKAKTTQAVISRIENMSSNPSVGFLKKIASVFGTNLKVAFD